MIHPNALHGLGIRNVHSLLVGSIMLALAGCASSPAMLGQSAVKPGDCSALAGVVSETATISSATSVAAPDTIDKIPITASFCRVQGVAKPSADSLINFEVWLPSAGAWTGRLKTDGTGGYAGATPIARMAADLAQGFVVAGSDMGHAGGESADWTMNHPEKVKDWGYRAHYFVTTAAKALTNAYYGKPAAHAYFEGCSNGGRQAMMMAQRYPELFDGIVAGAPSMFYGDTLLSLIWTGHSQVPVLGQPPVISAEKRAMMTARAHAACDAQDGLVDQQITNPRACTFDPALLACGAGENKPDCLTADEMRSARNVYRGIPTADGGQRWNGPVVGSEADWIPAFADNGGYAVFVGHFVDSQLTPPFKPRELDVAKEYDRIKTAVTPFMVAPSPDLSKFKARGGKLIQYHGWHDAVVAPHTSPNYVHTLALFEKMKGLSAADFDKAVANLSAADVAAATQTHATAVQQYHRLFMLPNVAHCGGGSGPSLIGGGTGDPQPAFRDADHDVVLALARWVEKGIPPESIVATKLQDNAVTRQRPLCVYPKQARYTGSGDINVAANFTCVAPGAEQPGPSTADLNQIRNSLSQRAVLGPVR